MSTIHTLKFRRSINRLIEFIFYGNIFYGFCIVALILETVVQLQIPQEDTFLYVLCFVATVLFYNYPYYQNKDAFSNNPRTQWHFRNHKMIAYIQTTLTVLLSVGVIWFVIANSYLIRNMMLAQWLILLLFPVIGGLYYGANLILIRFSLRQIAWMKPFIIGFVWAGVATVYPILYYDIGHPIGIGLMSFAYLLFLKNFMYISVLAIMFDIKDYASDSNSSLNTLVVKIGLRKTIFYVLVPLPILGVITFISFAWVHQFNMLKILLVMIPFFLLIIAAASLRKRRSLLYYLVVIDGLMILKALFDIIAFVL